MGNFEKNLEGYLLERPQQRGFCVIGELWNGKVTQVYHTFQQGKIVKKCVYAKMGKIKTFTGQKQANFFLKVREELFDFQEHPGRITFSVVEYISLKDLLIMTHVLFQLSYSFILMRESNRLVFKCIITFQQIEDKPTALPVPYLTNHGAVSPCRSKCCKVVVSQTEDFPMSRT